MPDFQPVENRPTLAELWKRVVRADDVACDGGWQDDDCPWCRRVVEVLRGGSVHCEVCGHINGLGHSCDDWECDDNHTTCRYVGPDDKTPSGSDANFPPPATSNPARIKVTADG